MIPVSKLEPKVFQFTITPNELFSNSSYVLRESFKELIDEIANKRLWEELEKLVSEGYWIEKAYLHEHSLHRLTIQTRETIDGILYTCCILTKKFTEDELFVDRMEYFINGLHLSKPVDKKELEILSLLHDMRKEMESLQYQISSIKTRR